MVRFWIVLRFWHSLCHQRGSFESDIRRSAEMHSVSLYILDIYSVHQLVECHKQITALSIPSTSLPNRRPLNEVRFWCMWRSGTYEKLKSSKFLPSLAILLKAFVARVVIVKACCPSYFYRWKFSDTLKHLILDQIFLQKEAPFLYWQCTSKVKV